MKKQIKEDAETIALLEFMLKNPGKDVVINQRDCTEDLVKITERLFDAGISPRVETKDWVKFLRDIYQIYNGDIDKTIEHIIKGVKG